jgi:hypothetical protein
MLCTGAPGILESLDDPRSLVSYTDLAGLQAPEGSGQPQGRHAAEGQAIEDADPRRRAPRARHVVQVAPTASR